MGAFGRCSRICEPPKRKRSERCKRRCRGWKRTEEGRGVNAGAKDATSCSDDWHLLEKLPQYGQQDHYQSRHQAHFSPQVVGQAVAFVVDLHGHNLPVRGQPPRLEAHCEWEGTLI